MGGREFRAYARSARPILTERDYQTVRKLVAERARDFSFFELGRLEALVRELTDYEIRAAESEAGFTVGWAEWTPQQRADDRNDHHRRWSDSSH